MLALPDWTPPPRPGRITLDGRYCALEPLDADSHADELFAASRGEDERHRYLFEEAPSDRNVFCAFLQEREKSDDPLWFAGVDKRTGRVEGRQTLMRVTPEHGVIETGNIYWGPAISRTPVTTEAFFLHADHVFGLGYRRYEWKCNALNLPSRRAAERFGLTFEGIFRQHMVVKGRSRDTAWFAMTAADWPLCREAFRVWLAPDNFDSGGRQRRRLEDIREELRGQT